MGYVRFMDLITSTDALAAACHRLSQHPFVTVDTEFLRETTYYPKLCLIQMAGPESAILVDPLAPGLSLEPFIALMADKRTVKVFHSARQDLEIIWNMGKLLPEPLFDSQIAAMVCGYVDSVSYEQLAHDLAHARIDKSSRFTDWSRRPLTDAQLAYALAARPLNGGVLHTAFRFGADATFADNDDVEAVLLGTGLNFSVNGGDTLRGFAGLDMSWRAAGGADFFLGAEAGYDSGDAFTFDVLGGLRIPL